MPCMFLNINQRNCWRVIDVHSNCSYNKHMQYIFSKLFCMGEKAEAGVLYEQFSLITENLFPC